MDAVLIWMPLARLWMCVGPDGRQGLGATTEDATAQWRAAVTAAALIERARCGAAATVKLGRLQHGRG
jgi:hypothetical protein